MIYYITAHDPATGNEWVMETHDTAESATTALEKYREASPLTLLEYRVDTIDNMPNLEIALETFSKGSVWSVGDPEPFEGTDSLRSFPFKATELFPPANGVTTSDCGECGAYVRIQKQVLHAAWHNKVADL